MSKQDDEEPARHEPASDVSRDREEPRVAANPGSDSAVAKEAEKQAAKQAKAEKSAAEAALENSMPKLNAVLKEIAFTREQRVDWIGHFKTTPIAEAEVLAIVAPEPDSKPSKRGRALRRRMIVARHGIKRWVRSQHFFFRLIYASGWIYLLVASATKLAWSFLAILSVLTVLVAKLRFVIRDMRPKYMQLVDRGYNERKLQLERLLETAQRWYDSPPTIDQIDQYRRDALTLVAGYVRDHRARFGSREILANLLVRDGDRIVVVGRSDGLRPVPMSYNRDQCALVAQAIDSGEARLTGDLYADFPDTIPGKKYNSIVVLPVWFRGVVVGAVSIDSQEMYHFHLDYDDLQVHLSPYVQLLAVTLIDAHVKLVGKPPTGG